VGIHDHDCPHCLFCPPQHQRPIVASTWDVRASEPGQSKMRSRGARADAHPGSRNYTVSTWTRCRRREGWACWARIVRIDNSRGIRIPRALIDEARLGETVEMSVG
jgi:hypothetical protein